MALSQGEYSLIMMGLHLFLVHCIYLAAVFPTSRGHHRSTWEVIAAVRGICDGLVGGEHHTTGTTVYSAVTGMEESS